MPNTSSPSPATQSPATESGGIVGLLKRFWLPIVLAIVAIVFIATNTNQTTFNIAWIGITAPLWLMLTITLLIGAVIGWYLGRRGDE